MKTGAFRMLAVLGWLWCAVTPTPATIILDTVLVGDVANSADTTVMQDGSSGYGSVSYTYRIATNEVTNGQYTEFLNAVDASGANLHALWNSGMTDNVNGGVLFNAGAQDGSKYSLKPGYGNRPVISVDFFDAMRFANWLNNGQGSGDTETGAYTLSLGGLAPRNAGVTVWIPSEDEWYKSAFYDPTPGAGGGDNWWLYPTRSNLTPTSIDPNGSDQNSANYARGFTTDVGGYTLAKSYYGTFD